jgi:DNA-binding MarR family transcriptional regulator
MPRSKPAGPRSSPKQVAQLFRELVLLFMERSAGEIEMLSLMTEVGLSMPQMVSLCMLQRRGAHSISGIATLLNLSLSATSHLVDRMVDRGLVERTEDVRDRRQKRVAITGAGLAVAERMSDLRVAEVARIIGSLPEPLTTELETVLRKVVIVLRDKARAQGEKSSGICPL